MGAWVSGAGENGFFARRTRGRGAKDPDLTCQPAYAYGHADAALKRQYGGHVDDFSRRFFGHQPAGKLLAKAESRVEVNVKHIAPIAHREFEERAPSNYAGVVDEDVRASERGDRLRDDGF